MFLTKKIIQIFKKDSTQLPSQPIQNINLNIEQDVLQYDRIIVSVLNSNNNTVKPHSFEICEIVIGTDFLNRISQLCIKYRSAYRYYDFIKCYPKGYVVTSDIITYLKNILSPKIALNHGLIGTLSTTISKLTLLQLTYSIYHVRSKKVFYTIRVIPCSSKTDLMQYIESK